MSIDRDTNMPEENQRAVIIIPARRHSSRLKEKLLLDESGKPLISYVIDQALIARQLGKEVINEIVVASDDEEILQIAEKMKVTAILTKKNHLNGTSRITEAMHQVPTVAHGQSGFVINLQADQPDITPVSLVRMCRHLANHRTVSILTLVMPAENANPQLISSVNNVKVLVDEEGCALDFSRNADALQQKQSPGSRTMLHVGVYGFTFEALKRLQEIPISPRSVEEGLEQLTALEHGLKIETLTVPFKPELLGIDTTEDYRDFVIRRLNDEISE